MTYTTTEKQENGTFIGYAGSVADAVEAAPLMPTSTEQADKRFRFNFAVLEKFADFIQRRVAVLTGKDWIILLLMFVYVDEFRALVVGSIGLVVLLNFLLLKNNSKKDELDTI